MSDPRDPTNPDHAAAPEATGPAKAPASPIRRGYASMILAYFLWGGLPIYFKHLPDIAPLEIVAHRILWSVLFLLLVLGARRQLGALGAALRNGRVVLALAASALLIGSNWLIYVWAVANHHIIAASLGYFLNPLVTVMLGVTVLKEKLRPAQKIAIGLAALGVANLALGALDTLWISVVLALSFALYGLIRKVTPVEALPGLMIETLLLLPLALGYLLYLLYAGDAGFGRQADSTILLMLAGVITSVPLLLFAQGARLLPLATVGLLQYMAPIIQFLLGLFLYHEPLGLARLASFVLIWIGLVFFTHDAIRGYRRLSAEKARG